MLRRWPILFALSILLPVLLAAQSQSAQSQSRSGAQAPHKPAAPPAAAQQTPPADDTQTTAQPPQIIVNPPAAPTPEWTWREQAAWASGIVLAVLGYVGIMLALRTLKRIERHLEASTATAHAALESSGAALALAQAIANSERPWIVVTVEPFLTMESSFKVMAANRGRSPARIVGSIDQVRIVRDEKQLPIKPEFEKSAADAPEPIVLLPGEATGIWAFNRDDLASICKNPESQRRVERWQETLFLYGRLTYLPLTATDESQAHETFWCCRYIHGEKSSALVMAGPPEYNRHS